MRCVTAFVFWISFILVGVAQDSPDKTGRAYDILTDFLVNKEDLDRQPHAFVAIGDCLINGKGEGLGTRTVRFLAIHDAKGNHFHASSRFQQSSAVGLRDVWTQQLVTKGNTYVRQTTHADTKTLSFSNSDEENSELIDVRRSLVQMFPVDQTMAAAVSLQHGGTPRQLANTFFTDEKLLQEAHFTEDGSVHMTFVSEDGVKLPWKIQVLFSKEQDFLPVDVGYFVTNLKTGRVHPLSRTSTKWTHLPEQNLYLPTYIDATAFNLNLKDETRFKLKLTWLLGDDVKALGTLDPAQHDWREKLRVALGFNWM